MREIKKRWRQNTTNSTENNNKNMNQISFLNSKKIKKSNNFWKVLLYYRAAEWAAGKVVGI